MLFGFALPETVVVMSGFSIENCSASFAMSEPRFAQSAAASRAAAFTLSGSFSQAGRGAFVSRRAENGPAFIAPTPVLFKYGTASSAKRVFCSVCWL